MKEEPARQFGRVHLDKSGKPLSAHQLDPQQGGHDAAAIEAAHGYRKGRGKAFRAKGEKAATATVTSTAPAPEQAAPGKQKEKA